MALTQPKCPSISFLKRLVQPDSLRLWNSSFMSGCPVSSLRDRKPTEERIPQPFSSFIFHQAENTHAHGPFCVHRCSLDMCWGVARWTYVAVPAPSGLHYGGYPAVRLPADVDVVLYLLCLLGSPSSSFLLRWRTSLSLSLSPCLSLSITGGDSAHFIYSQPRSEVF